MTRPLTCLTLLAAAGAGLYLYQEKHRAAMIDREINSVVHATEQTRERAGMLRAEYALLSEPDRLAGLAAQHLSLQPVAPSQFVQLVDLVNRLPPVGAPVQPPAALEPPAPPSAPLALVTPAPGAIAGLGKPDAARGDGPRPDAGHPDAARPEFAQLGGVRPETARPESVRPEIARPMPPLVGPSVPSVLPPRPNTPLMVQATMPPRAPRREHLAAIKPPEPEEHPVYAPVVQAFASQQPVQPIHRPSVQQAAAGLQAAPYPVPAPFVGSALGMARTQLPPPVPVAGSGGYFGQ